MLAFRASALVLCAGCATTGAACGHAVAQRSGFLVRPDDGFDVIVQLWRWRERGGEQTREIVFRPAPP